MRKNLRTGFTLIELMVAMALTLFIMVILSQAFALALETFAGMKGVADMQENLRTATILLRDDLSQDHFEGKLRVSDLAATRAKPQAGFFAVVQRSLPSTVANAPYFFEGNDANGMASYRATDHILYMTSKRRGNRQQNFFSSTLTGQGRYLNAANPGNNPPGFFGLESSYNVPIAVQPDITLAAPWNPNNIPPTNTIQNIGLNQTGTGFYNSQWAEIVYYLKQTGTTEELNNPTGTLGTPLFGLYRAQFVMVADGTNVSNKFPSALANSTFAQLSCNPGGTNVQFYSPADAALGQRVFPSAAFNTPADALTLARSETLVLPNVISFHVQIMPVPSGTAVPAFQDVPSNVYDTTLFNTTGYTNNAGLRAIQITLRVFDASGTRQTRQVTIVQDL